MLPALPVMVLSLALSVSPWQALLDRPAPTNADRAKRGLLPRKGRPSRVTYLDGAARRKGEAREFPELATPPDVREEEAAAEPVAANEPVVVAVADRASDASPATAPPQLPPEAAGVSIDRGAPPPSETTAERVVDDDGRILERRLGPDTEVLSVSVVGTVDDLPVVSSERTENGEIVERVEDRAGLIEVRRDPVGRFLSARALPGE